MTRPTVTPQQAHQALQECKAPAASDESNGRIRDSLVASAITDGADGKRIAAQGRVDDSVGQCVADKYDGKKPTVGQRVSGFFNDIAQAVSSGTDRAVEAAREAGPKHETSIFGRTEQKREQQAGLKP